MTIEVDLFILFGFFLNIFSIFIIITRARIKLEHRLSLCETYLKVILTQLKIDTTSTD